MKKQPPSFQMLGPASAGLDCALCGQGGSGMLRIAMPTIASVFGIVTARRNDFRVQVMEPTKLKFRNAEEETKENA